jgi:hypothetical protein
MLNIRTRWIAAVATAFMVFPGQFSFAAGAHHSQGRGNGSSQVRGNGPSSRLPAFANSWPYLRAENGIFGPIWAAPGPGSSLAFGGVGCGGGWAGYGSGTGWGCGLGDYSWYYPERLPYFNLFPPVYYSYADGAIAPRSTLRSSWTGTTAGEGVADTPPPPSPASPPLRIANPYYSAEK